MALGKGRTKRSSGSSCASATTTVLFVALCVFGVYMLSPGNMLSSDTTNRMSFTRYNILKTDSKQDTSTFQDNPGKLPKDAIKTDEDDNAKNSSSDQVLEVSADDEKQDGLAQIVADKKDQLSEHAEHLVTTAAAAAEIEHLDTKGHLTEENVKRQAADAAVEENPQGLKGTVSEEEQQKLNQHEVQFTEESSMTHNQETDQEIATTKSDDKKRSYSKNDRAHHSESKDSGENQKPLEGETQVKKNGKNKNTQEENKKEIHSESHENPKETKSKVSEKENEQQRQEEDSQNSGSATDREGATSKDQIEHDEAAVDSTDSSDQHMSSQDTAEEEKVQTQKQDAQSNQLPGTNENDKDNKHHQKKPRKKQHRPSKPSTTENHPVPIWESGLQEESKELIVEDHSFPMGESGIPKESKESKKAWSTQADQSDNHKEGKKSPSEDQDGSIYGYSWQLCNVTAGADYIPCLDNEKAISRLPSRGHFEHRERHCPEEPPTCLVPPPQGYKTPVEWPRSRDKIWYRNVPHTALAQYKGHQNWVKVSGEFLTFPGGGTQFIHGALHYIDFLQKAVPEIAWGKHTRTVLDVGCGVASFGGYLFDRDVLTISFAPKDEHEAQVQFALERGIPAISAVMGTQRLPFPGRVFDLIHCARCRVPWEREGGALLLELNRMLRPGGYFVWSATPVYRKGQEDVRLWKEMSALTVSMCWELVTVKNDKLNMVGAAIYRKPESNDCYNERKRKQPPMCKDDDDPNAAWYVPLQSCMHAVPVLDEAERGSQWPQEWPRRLQSAPYWLNGSQMGIYGKPALDDFVSDYEHWQRVVSKSYLSGLGISWSNVRNVMDMRAVYGGFAAALKNMKVWVLNVVNIDSPDTLPVIYERGLFGIYHDWCESFSTYPRTYDLLHADHLFSRLKKRCKIEPVMAEVDRIVRPGGKLIVRDESSAVGEVENLLKSLHWEVHLTYSTKKEGILSAQKSDWRPESYQAAS
ncbi:putative methyltransferase PMT27 [Heracleum sosnowskyi]|uniref:Methyltransferase PMT27 n=1 Tax=Heracleum sosnowskyi TaxID=360622 RepID=A0AAD8HVB3_9APIA|nr:putative methyltransferase PMT27 [Heracleum sosnowskyi]